jgi:hypothetical protein
MVTPRLGSRRAARLRRPANTGQHGASAPPNLVSMMKSVPDLRRAVLEAPTLGAPRAAYAARARADGGGVSTGEFTQEMGGLARGVAGEQPAVTRLARSAWRAGYTVRAHWHGGFIDRIELPAAAFLEHAEDLFAAHPITTVLLTDKQARPADDGNWVKWAPAPGGRAERRFGGRFLMGLRSDLPHELFEAGLTAGPIDTATLADEALSGACVRHGRRLAGLPELG